MQLAQRKSLAYQSGDDLRIFDFATKSAKGVVHDVAMVKCQLRQIIHRKPFDIVVDTLPELPVKIVDQRPIDDGYHRQPAV